MSGLRMPEYGTPKSPDLFWEGFNGSKFSPERLLGRYVVTNVDESYLVGTTEVSVRHTPAPQDFSADIQAVLASSEKQLYWRVVQIEGVEYLALGVVFDDGRDEFSDNTQITDIYIIPDQDLPEDHIFQEKAIVSHLLEGYYGQVNVPQID